MAKTGVLPSFKPRFIAVALAASLPIASPLGYIVFGTPAALHVRTLVPERHTRSIEQVEQFVHELERRVAPTDLQAWRALARWQHVLGRYDEACPRLPQ
jgi:cytochrome c-type biogenesis protein CcmH/NrfG